MQKTEDATALVSREWDDFAMSHHQEPNYRAVAIATALGVLGFIGLCLLCMGVALHQILTG